MCKHQNVQCNVVVNGFENTNLRYVELTGACQDCGEKLRFRTDLTGMSPDRPGTSFDGCNLVVPATFGEAVYDGKASQGYTISDMREASDAHRKE